MYEPFPHHAAPYPLPHYGWSEPPRRRRLNSRGYAVLLLAFVLLCALGLGALKLGLAFWHSPIAPRIATGAARIGTAAADAAMKEAKVPKEVREAVTEEADALRREVLEGSAQATPEAGGAAAAAH